MNRYLRIILYGLLTWFIPFLIAIPFYQSGGILIIDIFLFKSIMIISGGIIGALLIISLFHSIKNDYLKFGAITGFIWIFLNISMDILILLPMSGDDIPTYMGQIGIRYLLLPVMTIMAGVVATDAVKKQ